MTNSLLHKTITQGLLHPTETDLLETNLYLVLRGKEVHHYTPVQHMGFPPGVRCWCGAILTFNYHEPGQNKRRQAFFALHEACEYGQEVKIDQS